MKNIKLNSPYNVGDKIWVIHNKKIKSGIIKQLCIWQTEFETTYSFLIEVQKLLCLFKSEDIGNKVFIKKEQAEYYLKNHVKSNLWTW